MYNAYFLEKYARMRSEELQEIGRIQRLIREWERDKPTLWSRLTWQIGHGLIILGQRLQAQQSRSRFAGKSNTMVSSQAGET